MSTETQVTATDTAILVEGNLLACGAACLRKAVMT